MYNFFLRKFFPLSCKIKEFNGIKFSDMVPYKQEDFTFGIYVPNANSKLSFNLRHQTVNYSVWQNNKWNIVYKSKNARHFRDVVHLMSSLDFMFLIKDKLYYNYIIKWASVEEKMEALFYNLKVDS